MKKSYMLFFLLLLAAIVYIAGCTENQLDSTTPTPTATSTLTPTPTIDYQPIASGTHEHTVTVGSWQRAYRLHIPVGYSPTSSYPLVIVLHGAYGSGAAMEQSTGFSDLADDASGNFIVAYPDALYDHWADGRDTSTEEAMGVDDVAFISGLIDDVQSYANINIKKVFVCGISNGGVMTYRIAAELGAKVAAVGVVAACIAENIIDDIPTIPVSVIHFHGTTDTLMPYNGGAVPLGNGGYVISAEGSALYWVNVDNADTVPIVTAVPNQSPDDGTTVTSYDYKNGDSSTEVIFYKIVNGGHTWPSNTSLRYSQIGTKGLVTVCRDIDATSLIWKFFKNHPKP